MSSPSGVAALTINTRISHTVRTLTVRDDLVGWVISGRKRLTTPHGDKQFCANEVFLIPRSTQWDVINEADPGGSYQARIICFSPQLLEQFFERFGQFAAPPVLRSCGMTKADEAFMDGYMINANAIGKASFVASYGRAKPN